MDKWPILSTRSIEAATLLRTGNSPLSAPELASGTIRAQSRKADELARKAPKGAILPQISMPGCEPKFLATRVPVVCLPTFHSRVPRFVPTMLQVASAEVYGHAIKTKDIVRSEEMACPRPAEIFLMLAERRTAQRIRADVESVVGSEFSES